MRRATSCVGAGLPPYCQLSPRLLTRQAAHVRRRSTLSGGFEERHRHLDAPLLLAFTRIHTCRAFAP